jgi:hypothetical protein
MTKGENMTTKQRWTFISYSRRDKEFALELATELKSSGLSVWLDQLDIPTGARWDDEVEQALHESEIFLIVLTSASISSENVKDEIGYAIDHGKRILPVLLEACEIPLRLRRFQYVDFTKLEFDEGVKRAKQLLENFIHERSAPVARMDLQPQKISKPVYVAQPSLPQKKSIPRKWIFGGAGILALTVLLGAILAFAAIVMLRDPVPPVTELPPAQGPTIVTLVGGPTETDISTEPIQQITSTFTPVQEATLTPTSTATFTATQTPIPPTRTPTPTPTLQVIQNVNPVDVANVALTQFASEAWAADLAFSQQAYIAAGPSSGSLSYVKDAFMPAFASVNLADFISETVFYNPADPQNYWYYGFAFRMTDWDHSHYRLLIESNQNWLLQFVEISGGNVAWNTVRTGIVPNLNLAANGSNTFRLVVRGNTAYFFANDQYLATLDVSAVTTPGDVAIGVGTYVEAERSSQYENFTVWSSAP